MDDWFALEDMVDLRWESFDQMVGWKCTGGFALGVLPARPLLGHKYDVISILAGCLQFLHAPVPCRRELVI